jgi:DNA-binding CsgD family transcriptional regulator
MTVETAGKYLLILAEAGPEASAAPGASGGIAGLSAQERELVALVARGRTDAQIAAQLISA